MDVEEKKDIFDKLMHLPVLNIFEPFYKKHKEVLMYLFFGGLTFFLNIALYAWLDKGRTVPVFYKQDMGIRRAGGFRRRIFKADGFVFRRTALYSDCGGSNPCGIYHLAWI